MYLWSSVVFYTINNDHIHKGFFKEFLFAFTIPFTFLEIIKVLVLVEYLSATGIKILFNIANLTRNARLLTSLGTVRFELSSFSLLATFLVDTV